MHSMNNPTVIDLPSSYLFSSISRVRYPSPGEFYIYPWTYLGSVCPGEANLRQMLAPEAPG